jgi:hypothetical protein
LVFHKATPERNAARPIMCAATGAVIRRKRIATTARVVVAVSAK